VIELNLRDIKGSYDVIVSLGSACNPAMNLRRHNLRSFSGPLDWKVSISLSDVSRLLKNKFDGFMELKNMCLLDETQYLLDDDGVSILSDDGSNRQVKTYFVKDTYYNIISMHDFPILPNQHWTVTYPSFKEKLNYRINRFLEKIINSPSVLFVRWAGSYNQTVELKSVLSEIIKGQFTILILYPVDGLQNISDMRWGIDRVCTVGVPNLPFDNSTWDYVLKGITLTN
jgi:hypothetical protein